MVKLKLLSKLALSFKNIDEFDNDMKNILNDIGKDINLSKIHIFSYGNDERIRNEFKWCNKGLDINSFRLQNLKSLVVNPIIVDEKINGFMSFSDYTNNRKWEVEELELFSAISGIVSSAYEKKILNQEVDNKTNVENRCEKLTNVIESTDLATWEWNIQTDDLEVNEQWANILGYELDELLPIDNNTWIESLHPEDVELSNNSLERHMNGETERYECELRIRHKDGRIIWIRDKGKVTERDKNGNPVKMFGTHSDITEKQEQSLELERIFTVNLDLLCVIDIYGNFIKTNKAWDDILGYSSKQLEGKNILEFIHKDDTFTTKAAMGKLKNFEKVDSFINRYRSEDGEYHHLEWRANPYEGKIYAAARDITERIKYENKILEISNRDSLTGVYNRRYVFNRLEDILEEYKRLEKSFSICILDIDYFKKINDNYGHQVGDYVLKEFTETINENLRKYDILGRYGGEEFIIILNNANKKESNIIIERILDVVREKNFICNEKHIDLTFSAGISNCFEINKRDITIDKLVEKADMRMYEAKNTGRNKIVF